MAFGNMARGVVTLGLGACAWAAGAQDFIILENVQGLGGISADGRYVVGTGNASQPGAFRFDTTTGVRTTLGIGWPRDITGDGSAVVGSISQSEGAFLWTESEGYISLSDTVSVFSGRTVATTISDDGVHIAGQPTLGEAFRYSRTGAFETLEACDTPYEMSADGSMIAGSARFAGEPHFYAAVWDADGVGTLIQRYGESTTISADGRYAFGSMGDDGTPFRWSSGGGLEVLETVPGGRNTLLWAASTDGRRAAGWAIAGDFVSLVWDEGVGTRTFASFLIDEHGFDLDGWSFRLLEHMSDDGRSFAGTAIDPTGAFVRYVARVGEPCPADLDGDGALTVFDFIEFQNRFAMGDLRADLDGDGALTLFDFLAFQSLFAAGC